MFEVVADTQESAKHTAQMQGFVPIAALPGHVKDFHGGRHDLIVMELRITMPNLEDPRAGFF
jgi:hypothetical protein